MRDTGTGSAKDCIESARGGLHRAQAVNVTIMGCARERKFRKTELLDFPQALKMAGVDDRKLVRLYENRPVNNVADFHNFESKEAKHGAADAAGASFASEIQML